MKIDPEMQRGIGRALDVSYFWQLSQIGSHAGACSEKRRQIDYDQGASIDRDCCFDQKQSSSVIGDVCFQAERSSRYK